MRQRMTKAAVEQLERQIFEVLEQDNPQSVRHVFYRMTDPRLPVAIPKTEAGYILACQAWPTSEKLVLDFDAV